MKYDKQYRSTQCAGGGGAVIKQSFNYFQLVPSLTDRRNGKYLFYATEAVLMYSTSL